MSGTSEQPTAAPEQPGERRRLESIIAQTWGMRSTRGRRLLLQVVDDMGPAAFTTPALRNLAGRHRASIGRTLEDDE